MFVDSHCHLNDERFQEDLDEIIKRAKDVKIDTMLTICTLIKDVPEILALTQKYKDLFCTVGVHPHDAKEAVESGSLASDLRKYLDQKKVVGIGETGLDYYYENSPIEDQKSAFQTHIQFSEETGLPLIVHTRDAEKDTIDMLSSSKAKGVLHCFSGSQWLADKGLELGLYISISGIVTFKNADDLRQIVKSVPLDRLLVETDAPYLAPIPHRGRRNEPSFMIETAKVVAELKNVSLDELAHITTANFHSLFSKVKG